jgi:4-diphosphocytidyl-2-C-methyl-D-erythritol kinase
MATHVRSHSKINLGLYIGAPRPDGFHGLATVYQTLEVHDLVTVSARVSPKTTIRVTSNDERVPTDDRNTAWRMLALALEALGVCADVEIHIDKWLPVQGGMGAGSANASAALVGLELELGVPASPSPKTSTRGGRGSRPEIAGRKATADPPAALRSAQCDKSFEVAKSDWAARRLEIAARVGSDVPLFLMGGAVLGTDRGQRVEALPDFEPVWCTVALPEMGVSTAQAFRDWDMLCAQEGLTQQASHDKLNELSRAYVSAFREAIPEGQQGAGSSGVRSHTSSGENLAGPLESALVRTGILTWIRNDFERVVFAQHPSLAEIKRILAASDTPEAALYASLSGSGSALFGLYLTRENALAAQARLERVGERSILTRTLPREDYWRQMLLQEED